MGCCILIPMITVNGIMFLLLSYSLVIKRVIMYFSPGKIFQVSADVVHLLFIAVFVSMFYFSCRFLTCKYIFLVFILVKA